MFFPHSQSGHQGVFPSTTTHVIVLTIFQAILSQFNRIKSKQLLRLQSWMQQTSILMKSIEENFKDDEDGDEGDEGTADED
jgi:hypothetical protein